MNKRAIPVTYTELCNLQAKDRWVLRRAFTLRSARHRLPSAGLPGFHGSSPPAAPPDDLLPHPLHPQPRSPAYQSWRLDFIFCAPNYMCRSHHPCCLHVTLFFPTSSRCQVLVAGTKATAFLTPFYQLHNCQRSKPCEISLSIYHSWWF